MVVKNINFNHKESLLGLDIGQTSLKIMQMRSVSGKTPEVIGYGVSDFYSPKAIVEGEIVDQKSLAYRLNELLQKRLVGSITSSKVACTLPTSHTFSRPVKLPKMPKDHIEEAIQLEAEQYIPLAPDKLYIDYEITRQDDQSMEFLVMATPRKIVDSYMQFLDAVGLEPVALEPSMNAAVRLFRLADTSPDSPSILVDFGSVSVDICVFDKAIFVNSTLAGGGDNITELIAKKFGVSSSEAYVMKSKEGIAGDGQSPSIVPVIKPILENLIREIRRIVRYYNERSGHTRQISQIVTTGGGATLKGLNEYLSNELKMPVRMLEPWRKISFGGLSAPTELAKSLYLTVAGEAILTAQELHS